MGTARKRPGELISEMALSRTPRTWKTPEETGKVYLCYPPTAVPPADTDDFPVWTCAGTLEEARQDALECGGAAIYVCDYHDGTPTKWRDGPVSGATTTHKQDRDAALSVWSCVGRSRDGLAHGLRHRRR